MRDADAVRTTLDIEDDVLQAAREIALSTGHTIGKVVSDLARKGLAPARQKVKIRNGVPLLAGRQPGEPAVTTKLVTALRDEAE